MPQITGKPPFEDVYESCYEYVFNVVYVRLLHREDAEDVTETTFMKAMAANASQRGLCQGKRP